MADVQKPAVPEVPEDAERDDAIIGVAIRYSFAVLGALTLLTLLAVWIMSPRRPEQVVEGTGIDLPVSQQSPALVLPQIPFSDITRLAGIEFVHENGAYGDKLLPETMAGGVAFFDYNNNGHLDLLFINGRRWPWDPRPAEAPATLALYENDGQGNFRDVTAAVGLDISVYGMGVAVGDYDNDGDTDIFVSCVGPDKLFRNDGGRFVDISETAGVAGGPDDWGTSCGWFDYDNDGDLDLFVCRYLDWSKEYDLSQRFTLQGGGRAYGRPQNFGGTFPVLYRNDGNDTFTDVSEEAGIRVRNRDTGIPLSKSLGLAFADFDHDGYLDVVVANDTVQNLLFRNNRDGTFSEIGLLAGIAFDNVSGTARGAMGIDIAEHRRDEGCHAIGIGNFANEMSALYVSRPDGLTFRDEANATGLGPNTRPKLTFGVFFFDADLDGRLDFFQANGHLEDDISKVQATQTYEQEPQLFWNAGEEYNTEFVLLTAEHLGSDFVRPLVGRGAAYGDIDGDGDLDIVIVATGQAPRLLRNDQQLGHHWLRIDLEGTRCNRDAIGAHITLEVGGLTQRRTISPTRSYQSQCEKIATFGLGRHAQADRITIRWPDGSIQVLEHVPADQVLKVVQP